MEKKTVDVIINSKVYSLTGFEEADYLQKVAAYINGRLQELKEQPGFLRQSPDMQNVMLQLNIADDYFKLRDKYHEMQETMIRQDKDLYALKHEVVEKKLKIEELEKKLAGGI
ncbi:MAG: cell division protein ZapA [Lachnospiraceae bacterium]|jgi:cell division protein ZapA|nr:cell division protein ZapA [Lachnospiraceae bacterium]